MARKCIPKSYYSIEVEVSGCGGSTEFVLEFVECTCLEVTKVMCLFMFIVAEGSWRNFTRNMISCNSNHRVNGRMCSDSSLDL